VGEREISKGGTFGGLGCPEGREITTGLADVDVGKQRGHVPFREKKEIFLYPSKIRTRPPGDKKERGGWRTKTQKKGC